MSMLDRRALLQSALLVPLMADAAMAQAPAAPPPPTIAGTGGNGTLSGFLRIATDGRVTLFTTTSELGQGTHTAHAQIVADEPAPLVCVERITRERRRRGRGYRRLRRQRC